MARSRLDTARDYNGTLSWPVRAAHLMAAVVSDGWRVLTADWRGPLVMGLAGFLLLMPLDAWLNNVLHSRAVGGDVRRELMAVQQYGQATISVLVALVIYLLDPKRRARLADWALAAGLVALAVFPMKMLIGRPRPGINTDPSLYLGPWGVWPFTTKTDGGEQIVLRHAWELGGGISSDLWSMPSSHTAYAVVMSVFLGTMYPAIRPLAWALAITVGLCRVLFDAHWATDVVVGATVAAAIALPVVRGQMGVGFGRWMTRGSRQSIIA